MEKQMEYQMGTGIMKGAIEGLVSVLNGAFIPLTALYTSGK